MTSYKNGPNVYIDRSKMWNSSSVMFGNNLTINDTGTLTKTPSFLYPLVTTLQILFCAENLLVIFIIVFSTKRRKLPNAFYANLAVADFLYGSVALTLLFYKFRYKLVWQSGHCVCVLAVLFPHGILLAAALSVLCATVDRTIALVNPFRYEFVVTKRRVFLAISLTWIIALISIFWPLLFPVPIDESPKALNTCERRKHIVTALIIVETFFLLCASASLSLHFVIGRIARRHRKAISSIPSQLVPKTSVLAISKASRLLLVLTLICLFVWTPNLIMEYYHYASPMIYKKWFQTSQAGVTFLQLLPAIVSLLNPWLYLFRNKDLRAALKQLFNPCLCYTMVTPIPQR